MQWDGRTELAAGVVVTDELRGGAGEVVEGLGSRKGEGEELEALELLVTFKPGRGSGTEFRGSERRHLN